VVVDIVDLSKRLYRAALELRSIKDDTELRKHPALVYLSMQLRYALTLDDDQDVYAACVELSKGRRTIEIPATLKFSSGIAGDQFRDAARTEGDKGGESAESFERCVENLVRLKAEVGPDTDYLRDPEHGYSCFGWSGCGMIGAMVRHRDGQWSLHS
jgi:hypothetical protein